MVDSVTEQQIANSLEIAPKFTLEGHLNGVDCVKFNPASKTQLISGSFDKTYRSWDVAAGKCVKEVKAHEAGIWCLDFTKDGKSFATASADKNIKLWDSSSFKENATLKGHTFHVYSVSYSPDNTKLVSTGEDGTIRIWDLKKNSIIKTIETAGKIALSSQWSQEGSYILVSTSEGEVIVYDTANFNEITRTPTYHGSRAYSVGIDFNTPKAFGNGVFVGYEDHHLRRWKFNGTSLELAYEFKAHLDHIKYVTVSTNLGYYATGGRDGSAKIWDIDNNKLLFNLVGATDSTTQCTFAEDSAHTVAVSSYDQRVRIYQVPSFNH